MKTLHTLLLALAAIAAGCSDNLPNDNDTPPATSASDPIVLNYRVGREDYDIREIAQDGTGMRTIRADAAVVDIKNGRMLVGTPDDQLWNTALDGTGAIALGEPGSWPVLSPDGRTAAFVRSEGQGDWRLWLASSDGSGERVIMEDVDHETIPSWSPDGTKLAVYDGDDALCIVEVATGAVRVLDTMGYGYHDGMAYIGWSRDGSKLAYIGKRDTTVFQADLFTINLDGTGRRNLTNDAADESFPHWMPDGASLIYARETSGTGYHLARIDADGSNPTDLTARLMNSSSDIYPSISKDGTKVLYTAFIGDSDQVPGRLYLLDLASGSATKLSDSVLVGFFRSVGR